MGGQHLFERSKLNRQFTNERKIFSQSEDLVLGTLGGLMMTPFTLWIIDR